MGLFFTEFLVWIGTNHTLKSVIITQHLITVSLYNTERQIDGFSETTISSSMAINIIYEGLIEILPKHQIFTTKLNFIRIAFVRL